MRQENVQYLTEKEEEFVNLLIDIGTGKTIAKVLVFLANTTEVTSRAIERGADLRQPEVSLALKYLKGRGWINTRESSPAHKGRPTKIYALAMPISEILDSIEKEKKETVKKQLSLVKKMKDYL